MSVRANIEPLEWDSHYFGLSTARLDFPPDAGLLTSSQLDQYALVQAKVPAQRLDLIDGLSALGFSLVEGEVDLSLMIGIENAKDNPESNLLLAERRDIPMLKEVASNVFPLSRFRTPWYQPQDSGRFYATWVEKAVLGTFDHQCLLVNGDNEQPAGFVTLRDIGAGEARIGLLAVFPGNIGCGIGSKLMLAAQQWCQHHQIHQLRIATQTSNIAALRLYTRSGAFVESTAYWLYRG
ncbi:dTDP-4-amino-4,6-dideoxy-D-galactose acyltransferase [Photorhabdus laumondii subsp. laumondii]|uniref:dTDP-fucosamine acetyltransferase n=1 Tax=Photorhabdus laumondii subsp. laumondii TaxID=141679 RepID=A0A6L9JIW5_PHOLM|nr:MULTISPECIES: dTDP-4-amino-4,6-dideoxy-D-galactose acyltransferase [Photorhabdus]AXG44852.1 dTDP-4-amino-4,6-dideoxy-D-galactose acyltransferase [Photorhabdus laumondii subsp. laumondii]KTL62508.1 TDP-fucosamine acetyltransferase [Photorhabdus laumondii subsp. laumondii]MCC8383425.1 dTDP-4-amino-4,6-dideoxy-D-galactose acyltransferase [Photorhabdus laumondii]MCC8387979.1 dTDP-4-amino-4,6-dideoxy-D-galactose acyltransferase [Photorhabdus laumondii]MCC8411497.1 dTDP-4-amino-4,6-dideoxy-D-gala